MVASRAPASEEEIAVGILAAVPPPAATRLCPSRNAFVREARRWRPGLPFPLLPGPSLERYRALFASGELPAVAAGGRSGSVVSTGGDLSGGVARLLAMATGRPHRHVHADRLPADLAAHGGELVAVVGLADELADVGDWPGHGPARIGVLVGRDAPSLVCLAYRSLTLDAPDEDRVFVASHPLLAGADEADAASFRELQWVRDHRARLLVLRTKGRECCSNILDGMVCGRSEPLGTPLPPESGFRTTPCLHGEGCFRIDLTEAELLRACDVHATLIFAQSCSSMALGTNAYPSSISLALSLLEGTAVAMIGALGVHVLQRGAQDVLEAALEAELPLGEVVSRLEGESPLRGALHRFGLLGDPGLVLPRPTRVASPSHIALPGPRLRSGEGDPLASVARDHRVASRLERLRWLDVEVPDGELLTLRREMRALCWDPLNAPPACGISDQLTGLQRTMVADLVAALHGAGWDLVPLLRAFRQVSAEDAPCPVCARPIATRVVLRHRVDDGVVLQSLQCRRCGDVWWTSEPGEPTIEVRGPGEFDARRNSVACFEWEVANRGRLVRRGAVGYAFRSRKNLGVPPGESRSCVLSPGQALRVRHQVDLVDHAPPPDTHSLSAVALLDGILTVSLGMMRLA
jgi:hypothetical protein